MNDMKLILEDWRKYTEKVEINQQFGNIYLFENNESTLKDFGTLLEDYDRGKISGDKLYETWYDSVLYEHNLLNEGFKDAMQRTGKAIGGARDKIKNWVFEKSVQLFQMAQRGLEKTIQGAQALINKMADFRVDHPVIFKIGAVVAVGIAMFALMSALDTDSAHAAIAAPGTSTGLTPGAQGEISNDAYEAVRGLVEQAARDAGLDIEYRAKAIRFLDVAQAKEGSPVDFSTLQGEYGKFINQQINTVDGIVSLAREGDPEQQRWLSQLTKLGKSIVYKIGGVPTR
tara:strand:- start:22907 stop:23764 length:858 start_codon:yes stop_codon:yes gene_type:complete